MHSRSLAALLAMLAVSPALAEEGEAAPPTADAAAAPATHAPGSWFAHFNVGVPAYTSVGTWTNPSGGKVAAQSFNAGDRFALVQLAGIGQWVHPHVRITYSLQAAELATSQPVAAPAGAHTYTGMAFTSAIIWAAFTYGPLFIGAGPMLGARWMGNSARSWVYLDYGLFTCAGASIPLGHGFLLGLAVQVPVTFNPAVNVGVVPAALLARRF